MIVRMYGTVHKGCHAKRMVGLFENMTGRVGLLRLHDVPVKNFEFSNSSRMDQKSCTQMNLINLSDIIFRRHTQQILPRNLDQ